MKECEQLDADELAPLGHADIFFIEVGTDVCCRIDCFPHVQMLRLGLRL